MGRAKEVKTEYYLKKLEGTGQLVKHAYQARISIPRSKEEGEGERESERTCKESSIIMTESEYIYTSYEGKTRAPGADLGR